MTTTPQQQTHTPEPWIAVKNRSEDLHEDRIKGADGVNVAFIPAYEHPLDEMKANAQRIVACVNSLQGVVDPAAALQAAREALEWTLEQAEAWLGNYTGGPGEQEYRDQLQQARAALQQLNGEAQP